MDDTRTYKVVVNHEEQYSIWPDELALPPGWTAVGTVGPKARCLEEIRRLWTDLRPRSFRRRSPDAG